MPVSSSSRATAAPGRLLVLTVPYRRQVAVLVAGELDLASAPLLRSGLVQSLSYRPRWLLVDTTDLTFCDLSGLHALVDVVALAHRSGAHVTVQPSVQLAWLIATVRRTSRTSGQPGRDPSGCPLPRPAQRRTA